VEDEIYTAAKRHGERESKRARDCYWEYVKRDDEVLGRQIAGEGRVVVWLLMLDEGRYRDA